MVDKVQKFTTFTTEAKNQRPVAVLATTKIDALLGSIIQLDGRKSYDPENSSLTWHWRFVQAPIGSEVVAAGFKNVRPKATAVSFIPDKTGIYVVELIVNDGKLDSAPVTASTNIQLSRVPCGEGLTPDAHFLWSYLSNFWQLVEDREKITSIWSSVIQLIGADLITLWSNDYNKSLATIQGTYQRRWVEYSTATDLQSFTDQRVIVGKTDSGSNGNTGSIGVTPGIANTSVFYLPKGSVGDRTKTDFTNLQGNYGAKGRVIVINGETYTISRVENRDQVLERKSDLSTIAGTGQVVSASAEFVTAGVVVGDYLKVPSGADSGTYKISVVTDETHLEVTHVNDATVSFSGTAESAYTAVRPFSLAVVDEEAIPDGQVGVAWRIPHLLHIPGADFEGNEVRPGDVLVFEVTRKDTGLSAELCTQVVGVDRDRVGFLFNLSDVGDNPASIELPAFRQLVQDLKIVSPRASDLDVAAASESLISFLPPSINLNTRPFTTYRLVFKAKKIIHNTALVASDDIISIPALQESLKDPPLVLRENLDYLVEPGRVQFISTLFTAQDPAPDSFWAECSFFDNSQVIENNFGLLVGLSRDDLTKKKTRAPYLSAVKGLFFAYTNGPTVANIRLGLQILLGLPFTEERGKILEVSPNFSKDASGSDLGRILMADVDDFDQPTGVRRSYFYPMAVGLEFNSVTRLRYTVGDIVDQFVPLSRGVEVADYVKDPLWWQRALYGLEILKYFTFKVTVDSEVFDYNDVIFALDFVNTIKPAYTKVLTTALLSLSDNIEVEDVVGGSMIMRFFDNAWGLEATYRADDDNQQGVILLNAGSRPFLTRVHKMLKDTETYEDSGDVMVRSVSGWDLNLVRGRYPTGTTPYGELPMEGDLFVILRNQLGSSEHGPAFYEIDEVVDANTLKLLRTASADDPDDMTRLPVLDPNLFEFGTDLQSSIVRRQNNPLVKGTLVAAIGDNQVTASAAKFVSDGVAVGDHLVIEAGNDMGEYLIDTINTFPPVGPWPDPGTTPFVSFTETQLRLKYADGSTPAFDGSGGASVSFRIVRPRMQSKRVEGLETIYTGSEVRLASVDPITGDPRDTFTPGMVGLYIEVSNSKESVNNGRFLVKQYLSSDLVVLDSVSTTSDNGAQSIVYL